MSIEATNKILFTKVPLFLLLHQSKIDTNIYLNITEGKTIPGYLAVKEVKHLMVI